MLVEFQDPRVFPGGTLPRRVVKSPGLVTDRIGIVTDVADGDEIGVVEMV